MLLSFYPRRIAAAPPWAGRTEPNRALGAYVLDSKSGQVLRFQAPVTMLATGGAGKVYLYTSNPDVASGDGICFRIRLFWWHYLSPDLVGGFLATVFSGTALAAAFLAAIVASFCSSLCFIARSCASWSWIIF